MIISRVSVAGSGTMGSGIACLAARAGFSTTVVTRDPNKAFDRIITLARKAAAKEGKGDDYVDEVMSRISCTRDVATCLTDLVIECLPEDVHIKREWFRAADKALPQSVAFASNTSCLPLDVLFEGIRDRLCLGIHFFNPVHAMRLVEVAPVGDTPARCRDGVIEFLRALGKEPVEVPPKPGYVVNRMLDAFINRAARLVDDDGLDPETVDKCVRLGTNHPMGPLALADLIGIDTLVANLDALYQAYRDPEFLPAKSLERLLQQGRLGRKSGRGFFSYS